MSSNMAVIDNPFSAPSVAAAPGGAMAQSDEARAVAEVQAAMVIAKKFPRDEIAATDRILRSCTRPSLAEAALYSYGRGGQDVTGPSIRLAETLAQGWGNIQFGFRELTRGVGHDGVTFSDVEAYAWDLESNTKRPVSFRVRHWRDTKQGGYKLKDERDVYELTANMAQRRVRACILGVLPGDVVEAAQKQCEVTLNTQADTSPEAMKKMIDAFLVMGVSREQVEVFIQRRVDAIRPAQVVQLRKIYNSIKDGMSSATDWFAGSPVSGDDEVKPRAAALKDKIKQSRVASAPPAEAPAASYASIAAAINSAVDVGAVNAAMQEAGDLPADQREELVGLAHGRIASFDVPV